MSENKRATSLHFWCRLRAKWATPGGLFHPNRPVVWACTCMLSSSHYLRFNRSYIHDLVLGSTFVHEQCMSSLINAPLLMEPSKCITVYNVQYCSITGYLEDEGYSTTCRSFMKECIHLQEYLALLKRGRQYPLTINGFTLIQMIEKFAQFYLVGKICTNVPSCVNLFFLLFPIWMKSVNWKAYCKYCLAF